MTLASASLPKQNPRSPNDGVPESYRQALVERARDGDSDAFARLYDFYAERVFGYMHFHVGSEEAADDLTARVFLKAWKNIACYEPEQRAFSVWLYLIARQALLDFVNGRRETAAVMEIVSPVDEGLALFGTFRPCEDNQAAD